MKQYAVITGDVIDSTSLDEQERKTVLDQMHELIQQLHQRSNCQYTLFRGDSLQGIVNEPVVALRHALFIKAYLQSIRFREEQRTPQVDLRLAIGIGPVEFLQPKITESDGAAFQRSGRALDGMKKIGRGLFLQTGEEKVDEEWDVILVLLEEVIRNWTVSSAEILKELLWEEKEIKLSQLLGISQPAINSRKKHAGWEAIKAALNRFETYTIPSL